MPAQYMLTDGAANEFAQTPWDAGFDGFPADESGFFIAARVSSADINGFGDQQALINLYRGAGSTLTLHTIIDSSGGTFRAIANDTQGDSFNFAGLDMASHGVADNTVFWLGISVRYPVATPAFVRFYFGGTDGVPVWITSGAEQGDADSDNMKVDSSNQLTIGVANYITGPNDHWNGRMYEVQYFSNDFLNLQTDGSDLEAWFNAEDFAVNDGNTDTANDSADVSKLWTLTGSANMIFDDAGVAAGGSAWWDTAPPFDIDWTGANPSPPYQAAITIPQTYLTLITGTLYELDTDAFWGALKDREDNEDGMVFGDLQIRFPAYTVAGTTFAPAVLMQATVQFEDTGSQYSVRLTGSNNDVFDVEGGILIPTSLVTIIAQNSAGLIQTAVSGLTPTESAAILSIETDVAFLLTGQDLTNDQKSAEHITSKTTGKVILRNVPLMLRWEADAWEDEAKTIPYGTNSNAGIEAVGMLVSVAWS